MFIVQDRHVDMSIRSSNDIPERFLLRQASPFRLEPLEGVDFFDVLLDYDSDENSISWISAPIRPVFYFINLDVFVQDQHVNMSIRSSYGFPERFDFSCLFSKKTRFRYFGF